MAEPEPEPEQDDTNPEAVFARFDADADGFLSQAECKAAATAVFPDDAWDDELWPALCDAYGLRRRPGEGPGCARLRRVHAAGV